MHPGQEEPELNLLSRLSLKTHSYSLNIHPTLKLLSKMGFLSSVVMGSSAFILGMVFVCQVVSHLSSPFLFPPQTGKLLLRESGNKMGMELMIG